MIAGYSKKTAEKLLELAIKCEELKLSPPMTGNFSFFDRKNSLIYITPSQVYRHDLTYEDILILNPKGEIISNPHKQKASMEKRMHLNIYKTRPDVNTVIHLHNLSAELFDFYEELAYCKPGSSKLANMICEPISTCNICYLRDHGWIIAGQGIDNTFNLVFNTL